MNEVRDAERGHLCVDEYVADFVGARALAGAFELGLVDRLAGGAPQPLPALAAQARLDERGMRLLAGLLEANGVLSLAGDAARITEGFARALRYRDLIEAKLDFAAAVAPDFMDLFTTLLADPGEFFSRARLFELFSYDRCFKSTPENLAATARWMRFTTVLTRYEAAACIARHDFARHVHMLDVGGNSGEFALRVCRAVPSLRATVVDLPVVCELGMRHLRAEPEAARIDFVPAARGGGPLPGGCDLITFKSMLHDWPDTEMHAFLARAHAALERGGTLLIYERGVFDARAQRPAYAQIPIMLFFRSYRSPGDYAAALAQAGFRDVRCESVQLDMPFLLVRATK